MKTGSVYQSFSANLLYLCARNGSIAKVCNEMNVNRQQFNKYLSGASLPSASTLEKLAAYFAVQEIELFNDPEKFILRMNEFDEQRSMQVDGNVRRLNRG